MKHGRNIYNFHFSILNVTLLTSIPPPSSLFSLPHTTHHVPSSLIMILFKLSQIKKLAESSIKKGSLFSQPLNLGQLCDFHGNDILQFTRRSHPHPLTILRLLCLEKVGRAYLRLKGHTQRGPPSQLTGLLDACA